MLNPIALAMDTDRKQPGLVGQVQLIQHSGADAGLSFLGQPRVHSETLPQI